MYNVSGLEMRLKHQEYPVLIAATHIPELRKVMWGEDGVHLGAATTLTDMEHVLRESVKTEPGKQGFCCAFLPINQYMSPLMEGNDCSKYILPAILRLSDLYIFQSTKLECLWLF